MEEVGEDEWVNNVCDFATGDCCSFPISYKKPMLVFVTVSRVITSPQREIKLFFHLAYFSYM